MASFMNYAASASAARIIPLPLFILALSCTAGPSIPPSDPILHSPNDESQDKVVVLSLAFKPSPSLFRSLFFLVAIRRLCVQLRTDEIGCLMR